MSQAESEKPKKKTVNMESNVKKLCEQRLKATKLIHGPWRILKELPKILDETNPERP